MAAAVKLRQEICWPQEGHDFHDVVAETGADFKSDVYGNGDTFTAKADKPGRIKYVRTLHAPMVGTTDVTP